MSTSLDEIDLKILDAIQQRVPLVEQPFQAIASDLGLSEADVLARVGRLKTKPHAVIRQISAIFDSRSLGYSGCLVAAKVDESQLEAAVAAINEHPGVSHNYRRNHAYNLWYTVAVPPDSRLGLQGTVDELHRRSGALVTRLMPSLKLYKIGVKFNLSGEGDVTSRSSDAPAFDSDKQQRAGQFRVNESDKRMIRVLQQDLPIESRAFDSWASQAEVGVSDLLTAAQSYELIGCMRRFSAVLRHREAGFGANAMGAWIVPEPQRDAFGAVAASFSAVSHCYLRPTYEDWPYSIFTMVHGQSREECEQVLSAIAKETGVGEFAALYSSQEYKKIRVKYFTGDIERWEAQVLGASQR